MFFAIVEWLKGLTKFLIFSIIDALLTAIITSTISWILGYGETSRPTIVFLVVLSKKVFYKCVKANIELQIYFLRMLNDYLRE